MKLKQTTINELGQILKEEFNVEVEKQELSRFAYQLVGVYDLLLKIEKRSSEIIS